MSDSNEVKLPKVEKLSYEELENQVLGLAWELDITSTALDEVCKAHNTDKAKLLNEVANREPEVFE